MLGIHILKVRESNTDDEHQFNCSPLVIKYEKHFKKTCTLHSDFSTFIILLLTPLMLFSQFALGHQENHFRRTCPGCPHQHIHNILRKEVSPSPDDLRLEAIKHQILSKLGLRTRPDVNKTMTQVPRHLALETLYRAEAHPNENLGEQHAYFETDHRSNDYDNFFFTSYKYSDANKESEDVITQRMMSTESLEKMDNDGYHRSTEIEMDDFYARTSEIITFAEPGFEGRLDSAVIESSEFIVGWLLIIEEFLRTVDRNSMKQGDNSIKQMRITYDNSGFFTSKIFVKKKRDSSRLKLKRESSPPFERADRGKVQELF